MARSEGTAALPGFRPMKVVARKERGRRVAFNLADRTTTPPTALRSVDVINRHEPFLFLASDLNLSAARFVRRPLVLVSFAKMRLAAADARPEWGEVGPADGRALYRFTAYYTHKMMFDPEVQRHGLC